MAFKHTQQRAVQIPHGDTSPQVNEIQNLPLRKSKPNLYPLPEDPAGCPRPHLTLVSYSFGLRSQPPLHFPASGIPLPQRIAGSFSRPGPGQPLNQAGQRLWTLWPIRVGAWCQRPAHVPGEPTSPGAQESSCLNLLSG